MSRRSAACLPPRASAWAYNPPAVVAIAIPERSIGDVVILEVPPQVMFYEGAALLRARINDLVGDGRLKVLLDLQHVTHLDSFGVGVIASKYVSIRGRGGNLKLLRPSPRSLHVLSIAKLTDILECFEDEDAALRSFHSNPGS